jgi:hypothetical protein
MEFDPETVRAVRIREDARYGGIRVQLRVSLGSARVPVRVDIGFGDVVTPGVVEVSYPTILADNPAPQLRAYPKETVIAEKLEAVVSLGIANSRMKDLYDLGVLLRDQSVDRTLLKKAIGRTFRRRSTFIAAPVPLGLSEEFVSAPGKKTQWNAFLARNRITADSLSNTVASIRERVISLLPSAQTGSEPERHQR